LGFFFKKETPVEKRLDIVGRGRTDFEQQTGGAQCSSDLGFRDLRDSKEVVHILAYTNACKEQLVEVFVKVPKIY